MEIRRAALALGALFAAACSTPYAYRFELAGSVSPTTTVLDDGDVRGELALDPTGDRSLTLVLTNQTPQVLEVAWNEVSLVLPGGTSQSPRPEEDQGWIPPGATQRARLFPFVLPGEGASAAAYEGASFVLDVPMTVRLEPRLYHYALTAHVAKL